MIPRLSLLLSLTTYCLIAPQAFAGIPSGLPQTQAVHSDLAGLKAECDRTIHLAAQLRDATRSVRKNVDHCVQVTKSLRAMDRRLVKLIDRLKPYESLPKVRTVCRTLKRNLQNVQTQLHKVRLKTDRCEKKVLRPTQRKLRDLEQSLATAEHKLRGLKRDIDSKMQTLNQTAQVAQHSSYSRQLLESSAGTLRHATSTSLRAVRAVGGQVDRVGYQLQRLNRMASKFRTVGNSLDDMDRKMRSPEEMVAKLDKAIGKRLTIKIPFSKKSVSFSIRQILEKPGEVMNVVLKPLEKLADKVLQPILGKMKLEMKPPKGLHELSQQLASVDTLNREFAQSLDSLIGHLHSGIDQGISRLRSIRIQVAPRTHPTQRRPVGPRVQYEQPVQVKQVHPVPAKGAQPAMFLMLGG